MSDCEHRIIEIWEGKLVINTMHDYVPVKYCPLCGKFLIWNEIYNLDPDYYTAIGVKKKE